MSQENENVAGTIAQTPVKKGRRGVSNETKAVSQLKFHEKDAAQNGLFIGHLHEVSVDWSNNPDSVSFAGISIPRLTFHFASNHANVNETRHVYQTLFPVESSVETMDGGKGAWRVNNVFSWIKHILDVYYLKGREMTPEEENALVLAVDDSDEQGNYVPVETEVVVAAYRSLFENAADMLNGKFNLKDGDTPKPYYKTQDGKYIPCWMKLIRCKKYKNEWQNVVKSGDLAFDFIGSGLIELQHGTNPPAILRLDLSKESITPKEVSKTPTIGAPMMPNIGGVMATPMMGGMPNPSESAFAGAQGEMPF